MQKVSIIVPIYNEENNLNRCIDSLINQTYKNLEIILIDDGSTDNSPKIIDSYDDSRIVSIHKKNTGIGDTRNLGIEKSSGDYIMFVDSDDYIELNCVEKMLTTVKVKKADMAISNYYLDTPSKTYKIIFNDFDVTSLNKSPNLLCEVNLGPCNKIYRKKLFKDKSNRFPVNLKYEDAPVVVKCLCKSKFVAFNNNFLFHYIIKSTGETLTRDKRIFDILKICTLIKQTLDNYNYVPKTDIIVKILASYLKNSYLIDDDKIRNQFINDVYSYLYKLDKQWYNCLYMSKQNIFRRNIIKYKSLLKLVNCVR